MDLHIGLVVEWSFSVGVNLGLEHLEECNQGVGIVVDFLPLSLGFRGSFDGLKFFLSLEILQIRTCAMQRSLSR